MYRRYNLETTEIQNHNVDKLSQHIYSITTQIQQIQIQYHHRYITPNRFSITTPNIVRNGLDMIRIGSRYKGLDMG